MIYDGDCKLFGEQKETRRRKKKQKMSEIVIIYSILCLLLIILFLYACDVSLDLLNLSKILFPLHLQQQGTPPPSSRSCVVLDAASRARLRQLRGPRSQVPKAAHACVQCSTSYKDCDALIMHRLRHVKGKHWPCLVSTGLNLHLESHRQEIRNHDLER